MTDNQYQADGHDNTQNAAGAPYIKDGAERVSEGAVGAQPQYIEQPEAAPQYAGQPGAGGHGAGAEAAHAANAPGAPPFYGEQPGAANSTPYYADQPGAAGAYGAPAYYTDQSGPAGAAGAAPQTREEWERQQREIQDREWQNRQQMYNRQLADARTVQAQQWRQPWPPYGDGRYADRRQPDQYAQGRPNYAPPYQDGRFYYDAGQPQGAPQQGVPSQQQDTRGKSKKRKTERQSGRRPFMQIIAAGLAGALIASAVFISGYFVGNSGFFKNAAVAQPLAGADASAADDSGRQDAQPAQPPNDGGGQSGGLGGLFKIPQDRLPLLPPAGQQPGGNSGGGGDEQKQAPQESQNQTAPNGAAGLSALTLNPPGGGELSVPEIYQKVYPSIVGVRITFASQGYRFGNMLMPGYEQSGEGSGIIIREDGYIMTNHHVISEVVDASTKAVVEGSKIEVFLPEDSAVAYPATIVGYDQSTDLCVLKIDKNNLRAAELGDADKLVVGEFVVAIGNPGGMEYMSSCTFGVISGLNRSIRTEGYRNIRLIQTDAAINPGNSGGALINKYGQVIGVNSIKIADQAFEGLGFAIPINAAALICDDLMNYNYVKGRPYIGITAYSQYTEQLAAQYGMPKGVYVYDVDDSGPAVNVIKKNDIIVKFANVDVPNFDALETEKAKYKPGDRVKIQVYRDWSTNDYTSGKLYDLEIVLGEKKN